MEVISCDPGVLSCQLNGVPGSLGYSLLCNRHLVGGYLPCLDNLVYFVRWGEYGDIDHGYLHGLRRSREHWRLGGADADWHAAVKAAEGSKVEGVLLP